ncbi:hypothetical protein REPUB_Repub06bG0180800 [Reevesia pubescens]
MKISIKKSTMITPFEETPNQRLWLSNMDLVMIMYHNSTVYFYKPKDSCSNFFDSKVLKEALRKVLVPFYPIAGRLGRDENGRLEIVCNAEGVLFIEAETTSVIDDLVKDITNSSKVPQLVPKIDYSEGISSYPLIAFQVTTFKCGGVSLGVSSQHTAVDGPSGLHFINSWADTARGLSLSIAPFLDRTVLRARNPPTPRPSHVEFEPSPSLKMTNSTDDPESQPSPKPSIVSVFKITADQVNALKAKVNDDTISSRNTKYSTYSILTAHIWRSVTKARDLEKDQELKLTIPIDGRNRLKPPLPLGYFGNVIFLAAPVAVAGDLVSEPLIDTVKRIHEILKEMDDDYLRAGIDYIEKANDITSVRRTPKIMRCPNLYINSWMWLPIHDADFGWGRPIFMRPTHVVHEGKAYILPSPTKDESLTLVTSLETTHMKAFESFLYQI